MIYLILLRVLFVFLPVNWGDLQVGFWNGQSIFDGLIPYQDFENEYYIIHNAGMHIHPPLFYYIFITLNFISGHNIIVFSYLISTIWAIFDIVIMYLIYQIVRALKNEEIAKIATIFYGISPTSIIVANFLGVEECTTLVFSMLGLFYYMKEKHVISAIFFGIGINIAILPIFYFIFIGPELLKQKKIKEIFIYGIIIFTMYLLFSLPFLIYYPSNFLNYQVVMLNRGSSISLIPTNWIDFFDTTLINFSLIGMKITLKTFLSLIMISVLLFYFTLSKQAKNIFYKAYILQIALPILTFSLHLRLIYWIMPFFIMCLFKSRGNSIKKVSFNKNLQIFMAFIIIFEIALIIIHYTIWKDFYNLSIGTEWFFYFEIMYITYLFAWFGINLYLDYWKRQNIEIYLGYTLICLSSILLFLIILGKVPNWVEIGAIISYLAGLFLNSKVLKQQ